MGKRASADQLSHNLKRFQKQPPLCCRARTCWTWQILPRRTCVKTLSKCLFYEEVDLQFQKVKQTCVSEAIFTKVEPGTIGFPHGVKKVQKVCSKNGRDTVTRVTSGPQVQTSIEYVAVVC